MNTRKLITTLLICFITLSSYSQSNYERRLPANEKGIPELVKSVFDRQFPSVFVKGWYITHITYWANDISSGWYTDWYGQRTVVVYTYEKPNYYEVEFIDQPGELSRALYNKYGYRYETRTQLKGLPPALSESLQKTKYATWKVSKMVEKIDISEWPDVIYRFSVSKGMRMVIIRMNSKGEIVQQRYLDE